MKGLGSLKHMSESNKNKAELILGLGLAVAGGIVCATSGYPAVSFLPIIGGSVLALSSINNI